MASANAERPLHELVADKVRALTNGDPTKLKLLLPNGAGGNLKPIIAAFEQMTGVLVESTETLVDEINAVMSLDAISGLSTYDVALPATFGLADLASSKAILPITEFAKKHEPPGFRDDILFSAGDSFNDELYGFQTDGDVYMMFYQKQMLENSDEMKRYSDIYGKPLAVPDTWAELDRQMAYFTRPEEDKWGGLLFRTPSYLVWGWWMRFHAKGVWPFSPEMVPQIASDAGVEALEDMIRVTEYLHPKTLELGLFENWERYSRGDIFCNIGWGGSQKYFNQSKIMPKNGLIFGPTPGGIVDGKLLNIPYFNWGWNYVVLSNSQVPEIAYLFALFASSPEMSTLAVRQADGFFDPFRPEHYDDAGIKSAYTAEFLRVHRDGMKNAIPDLYLQSQGAYRQAMQEWLVRALRLEVSPKKALDHVAQRWDLITHSVGLATQQEKWKQLRAKYPVHIQALLQDIE